ncbi:unnamed protein product [Prorocentrum cordatum]|uniref:1,3-beta-glucan synthase n=1 Tax=Prorocentrum cordatum TaxID=2364126 RepID=A0ABN9YL16_9DINO|nr:unnamed protein product [Polarella glacialis]
MGYQCPGQPAGDLLGHPAGDSIRRGDLHPEACGGVVCAHDAHPEVIRTGSPASLFRAPREHGALLLWHAGDCLDVFDRSCSSRGPRFTHSFRRRYCRIVTSSRDVAAVRAHRRLLHVPGGAAAVPAGVGGGPCARQGSDAGSPAQGRADFKLVFRIVTRGENPSLVKDNVLHLLSILEGCLSQDRWALEVVTDSPLDLAKLGTCATEILVPSAYTPPHGCRYKARALQYAVLASTAGRMDWIVHLDEETTFDADTVSHILVHCRAQNAAVQRGAQIYGHTGQGVIVYNVKEQVNLLCCLADSIRVADDLGKFALQYKLFQEPLIGMHGSFVVCSNAVEMDVGFDWGIPGSITEDTFFALKCAEIGVQVIHCGGCMYEQSPFSVQDFAKQRCRWFSGIWLCVKAPNLPLPHRAFLGSHTLAWGASPFVVLASWVNVLCMLHQPAWVNTCIRLLYAFPLGCYVLGFLFTYRPSELRHGVVEYLMLLFLQTSCIPIFAVMEAYGIALALWTKPFTSFELVQKEVGELFTNVPTHTLPFTKDCEAPASEEKTSFASTDSSSSLRGSGTAATERLREAGSLHEDWASLFADAPSEVHVPQVLRPRSGGPGDSCIEFPWGTLPMIRQLASRERAPLDPLDVVAAALAAVISYVSNEDLMILGVEPPTGASEGETPVLPVRVHVRHDLSFLAYAANVRGQRVASSDLHQASGCPPLATILLHGGDSWNARALDTAPFQFAVVNGHRDRRPDKLASVLLMAVGDELLFMYRAEFLTAGAAEVWVRRFVQVVQAASDAASACLRQLPLLNAEEDRAVADRAGKAQPYSPLTLHEQFLAESKSSASKVAVVCGGENVTYADLRVAALKVSLGITTVLGEACHENLLIGMLFERSADVAAVIFGVLFSGCGYLPIDARFPPVRIKDILSDAGASCPMVLLGNQEFASSLPTDYPGQVVCASRAGLVVPPGIVTDLPQMRIASPQSLVYCMYTSGTTGKPKGVMVEHQSLSMRIGWFQRQFSLSTEDTVLFKTQYTFGISEWEIFWPLTVGATMLVAPMEIVESLPKLLKLIEVGRCTHAFFVPSHLTALLRHWLQVKKAESHAHRSSLRWVVACGEALPRQTVRDFSSVLPQASIYNLYGPTEGSMTWRCCDHDDSSLDALVPLGTPIDNTVVLLLDRWQRPVPDGVPGEICFGHCLARGYLNRPDLTAERFVANPLPAGWLPADSPPCPRLYRTGDMAVWMDGELHFAGRVDRQVKFRGYRIELGAIEAAMREAFQARIAKEVPWLCCLLVPASARRPGGELVAFLQSSLSDLEVQVMLPELSVRLPAYMVPTKITSRPNLPTLSSGKVDMRALQSEASGDGEVQFEGPDSVQNPALEEAIDSLGQIRRYAGEHSTSLRVGDNLRAFYMYGVVMDHYYGCSDGQRCRLVLEALVFPRQDSGAEAAAEVSRFAEVLFRSTGNYKSMSGFMMISAYADARYTDASHFGKTDVVMLLAYLQMMWIIDPVYLRVCLDENLCYPSGHRWYLLAVLMIKAMLVLFRLTRLPPLVQCIAVTVLAFTMPPEAGCVVETNRDERCAGVNDNATWTAYYSIFDIVWTIFIRGGSEEPTDFDASPTILSRHYLFFAMQYFWTFHYGHHCVQIFWGFVDELPCRTARVTRWCSFVGFLIIELTLSGVVGPGLYDTMQGTVDDGFDPDLLGNLAIFLALSASVAFLAYAISGVKTRLQTLGSTTLGCYIAHWYLVPLVPYFEKQIKALCSLGYFGLPLQVHGLADSAVGRGRLS